MYPRVRIYFGVVLPALILFTACRDEVAHGPQAGPEAPAAGGRWERQAVPMRNDLLGVCFIDAQHGWAVGDIRQTEGLILGTNNGGSNWTALSSSTEYLSDVQFLDRELGWAVGYAGRIIWSGDGGRTWQIQRAELPEETLNSVCFVDRLEGWAAGAGGLILHTSDGGLGWERQTSGTRDDLWRISMIDAKRGWIAGEAGTTLYSGDGGKAWVRQKRTTGNPLLGLCVVNEGAVFACGTGGLIVRLVDEGRHQGAGSNEPSPAAPILQSGTTESLNAIIFLDEHIGWAAGSRGTILFTTDGGRHWAREQSPVQEDLMALAAASGGEVWAVGRAGVVLHRTP